LQLSKESNTILIDTRTPSEFSNKDSVAVKNVGRLKNAVNIPLDGLSKSISKFKGKR
jgi:3-mercaptopyruvate sulfurtransferase SseA